MPTSRDKDALTSRDPSGHFVLPSRTSTALQIRSPEQANKKPNETKKESSLSPKKAQHNPASGDSPSVSAQASPFGISRPITRNGDDGDVAVNTSEPQLGNSTQTNWSQWPNLSFSPNKQASDISPLDVYAPSYVPLWLRAVNDSIAVSRFSSLLESINFPEYIGSFAGRQYLQPLAKVNLPAIQNVPVVHSISSESLTSDNYEAYFWEALQNEVSAESAELRGFNIFVAPFEPHDPLRYLFRVKVPGLRENSPRIDIGDTVLVRPLFHRPDAPELTISWYAPGGGKERGLCAPAFAGIEYNATVWGVARAKEEVLLRVDGLTQLSCNIMFAVQEQRITPIARSITSIAESLRAPRSAPITLDWLRRMLFPTPTDGVVQLTLPKGTFPDMKWFDMELNYEQQKAVNAVFNTGYGSVPYLISGPPGTGKTKTIVEMTLQLLRRPEHVARGLVGNKSTPHILLCAPSDSAADTLASRLATRLTPVELFRLNGWSRSFAEVPGLLLPYSYVEKDLFSLPSFETLMSYKVVVTTCRDADMLVQGQLTNQTISHLARSTLRVISPDAFAAVNESQLLHWTALLVDEAAQATEPETLIPLSVILPPREAQAETQVLTSLPQLIMAGDEYQLGPRLSLGKSSALSTSLFARLFARAFYTQHPLFRQRGSQRLTASMLPMNRPAFTNLVRNYRSHPSILSTPSLLFYNDTLLPESTTISDIIRTWPGWKSPRRWPVLFVQNTTPDNVESVLSGNGTGAGALFNHGEVLNALRMVQSILDHRLPNYEASGQVRQAEIVVMSPFRAQVHLLRKLFRENGLYDVNIGPLEAFQGLESRIVVLCTTRTRRGTDGENAGRFVREDQERGLGVIGEPKRFNVAITRAKEGLIVLGDPETLTVERDPCWEAFTSFCARNGCVMHEGNGRPTNSGWVKNYAKKDRDKEGRLERALVFAADVTVREAARIEQRGFGYPESPKTRREKRVSLKGQMPTSDEEMWNTGLQMAEDMDEATRHGDANADLRGIHGEKEDADPWNPDRYAANTNGDLIGQGSHAGSPVKDRPNSTTETGKKDVENKRIFSSASAKEFDRDPKAEFERTDCATQ